MKKYIYHAYIQFVDTTTTRNVNIIHWDTLVSSECKIDNGDRYAELKQKLWENAGDKVHSTFKDKESMGLLSFSFLHEVEE